MKRFITFPTLTVFTFFLVCLPVPGLIFGGAIPTFAGGGGNVLAPNAQPRGYSLTDMARATARFNTSFNNLLYYPNTPFQILYADFSTATTTPVDCDNGGSGLLQSGTNSFTVAPGTPFYVPFFNVTDSPPVLGTYPSDESEAVGYFFGPTQIGGRDFEIIVDGKSTPVGPEYLAGPVETAPLLDGGGTHIITLGVFLTPLSVGTHTVTIRGQVAGDLLLPTYGISCLKEDFTYVVEVKPDGRP